MERDTWSFLDILSICALSSDNALIQGVSNIMRAFYWGKIWDIKIVWCFYILFALKNEEEKMLFSLPFQSLWSCSFQTPFRMGTNSPSGCNSAGSSCSWHNAYQMQQWTIFLSVNMVPDFTLKMSFNQRFIKPAFTWHSSQQTLIDSRVFADWNGYV